MLLVLCFLNVSWAKEQEEEKKHQGYRVNAFVLMRLENASFYIYNPPFKAKGIYKSIEEAKNRTPEELFISMASETTQEWVDHNNWPGRSRTVSARAFAYRAQLDKEKNYRELLSKLSFCFNGLPTAIIKYYFVDDGKRTILASMVVQKIKGRWHSTAIAGLEHLEFVVKRVKPEYLKMFFRGRVDNDAPDFVKNLLPRIQGPQGILNIEALFEEIAYLIDKKDWETLFIFCDKSNP